jgi:hypothetical protein
MPSCCWHPTPEQQSPQGQWDCSTQQQTQGKAGCWRRMMDRSAGCCGRSVRQTTSGTAQRYGLLTHNGSSTQRRHQQQRKADVGTQLCGRLRCIAWRWCWAEQASLACLQALPACLQALKDPLCLHARPVVVSSAFSASCTVHPPLYTRLGCLCSTHLPHCCAVGCLQPRLNSNWLATVPDRPSGVCQLWFTAACTPPDAEGTYISNFC